VSRPGARPRGRVLAVTLALVLVPAAALADDLSAEERARRDRAQALADEASALLADYRHDAALAKLDEALEVAPASGALWNSKAWLFFSTGEMEKALEHFEKALELNPTLARAHTGRAMSLFALGRYREASKAAAKAVARVPRNPDLWRILGLSMHHAGDPKSAIEIFDRALALAPRNGELWALRGVSLFSLGRYEAALESFDRSLSIDRLNEEAWMNKASCLVKLERAHMQRFAGFLKQLREKKDGQGRPLLDSTIVLLGTGMGDASRHSNQDLPTLVAGGGFRHGQHIAVDRSSDDAPLLGDLYITLMQQLGMEADSFSNATRNLNQLFI